MRKILTCLLLFSFFQFPFAQTTWYVRADAAPGTADGTSWATAIPHLQDALEAAEPGDVFWIAEGVYHPTTNNDRTASFVLKNGMKLYGGFAGTETQLDERDWAAHPTLLSGDIGAPGDSTDNTFCLLYITKTDLNTRVDGLIFELANANNPAVFPQERSRSGSAIYLNGLGNGNFAQLFIANCTFRRNRADNFGAIFANGGNSGQSVVRLENCRFIDNSSNYEGGALVVQNFSSQTEPLRIANTLFQDNRAQSEGGAIYAEHHQNIEITDCRFIHNSAMAAGNALSLDVYDQNNTIRFSDCRFQENFSSGLNGGGAIHFFSQGNSNTGLEFRNCVFEKQSAKIASCLEVYQGTGSCKLRFNQCIFRQNTADNGSILSFGDENKGNPGLFDNCLFFQNKVPEFHIASGEIDTIQINNSILIRPGTAPGNFAASRVVLNHCLMNVSDCSMLGSNVVCGPGNLSGADPRFQDASTGDFHLQPCSPAINAGDNAAVVAQGPGTDPDGRSRVLNKTVDIGPYEHELFPYSITPASCPDAPDASIHFGNAYCPPLLLSWTNGSKSGARTDSLLPGTYIFTLQDAAGHADSDTLLLPTLPPIAILPNVANVSCYGLSDGVAGIEVTGGTPPYAFLWENGSMSGFLFNLPGGSYPVTVTDANGCSAEEAITVIDPGLIQLAYMVTPASAPGKADGQIRIDSVLYGTGPFSWLPAVLENLLPGTYPITVTDANGCVVVVPVLVGIASATGEISGALQLNLRPNPARVAQRSLLHWSNGDVDQVWVQDAGGRILQRIPVQAGPGFVAIPAPETAGVYWVSVRSGTRGRSLLWVLRE